MSEREQKPYPHQRRAAELLLQGKNVILQAPTGAGKTKAALMPFANVLKNEIFFPRKCIYTVPMRVLATQFLEQYQSDFGPTVNRYLRSQRSLTHLPLVDIQTGEQSNDPHFEAALTFATIDQVLSSFLISPYGTPLRNGNINAGAVIASYLVFDEFHLFDPRSTLPTTLEMLRMLRGITPFMLMTATFTSSMLSQLAEWLDAEVVGSTAEEQAEFKKLPSQQKTRRYHVDETPLSAETVLEKHAGKTRSIVVCNTVERARTLFESMSKRAPSDIEIHLLHSRFLPDDRKKIEDRIRAKFGKDDDGSGNLIVVSTQAIEVGIDITSHVLHSELAPANAIVQRAGRCARYQGNEGDVFIYRYTHDTQSEVVDLTEKNAPYLEREGDQTQKDIIRRTWAAFAAHQGPLDYASEQEVLNAAHATYDEALCVGLRSGRKDHRDQMFAVMQGDIKRTANLVREVFSQRVTVHAAPDVLLDDPFRTQSFSIHAGSVQGYVKTWLDERQLDTEPPFRVCYLHADDDPEQANRSVYSWKRAMSAKDVLGAALIVVHPDLVTYDCTLGFLADRSGDWQATLSADEPRTKGIGPFRYRLETYEQHVELVFKELCEMTWPELQIAASKLERRFKWPENSLWIAARLAALLHDVGKLSTGWQMWVREWQRYIGQTNDLQDAAAYAHSDRLPEHREAERSFGKRRPPHAVESVVASGELLMEALANIPEVTPEALQVIMPATMTAIACHHTPHVTGDFSTFKLEPHAAERTSKLLRWRIPELQLRGKLSLQHKQGTLRGSLVEPTPTQQAEFLAYALLARALRRADWRGTELGK